MKKKFSRASSLSKVIKNEQGVALFMVLGAVAILAVLVTEFTYISQVNLKMAYDRLDQVKAKYLAKSAVKISLLRLKAYKNVKGYVSNLTKNNPAANSLVPNSMIDQIWSFPLVFPLPTNLPGTSPLEQEQIKTFTDESGLDGTFSAIIESESRKFNLNLLLPRFAPPQDTKTNNKNKNQNQNQNQNQNNNNNANQNNNQNQNDPNDPNKNQNVFDPELARKTLADYMLRLFQSKLESDDDFSEEYRDFQLNDLLDNIYAWADYTYEAKVPSRDESIAVKRAPFYSITELHMLPLMDEKLYDLFSKALTVSTTPGINVNTMEEPTLRALIPNATDEEIKAFFEFRDATDKDNSFRTAEDYFSFIKGNFSRFSNDENEVKAYREELEKSNIRFVVDESEFKIEVLAQVNQAIRRVEAAVTLVDTKSNTTTPNTSGNANNSNQSSNSPGANITGPGGATQGSGLKITFFRML